MKIRKVQKSPFSKIKKIKWTKKKLLAFLFKFLLGAVGIFIGAELLVNNGEKLATYFNISEEIIGVLIISVTTCLPELITTIVAIRKKNGELALGNIMGSNIINITLLFGLGGMISRGNLVISSSILYLILPLLILLTFVLVLPIFKTQKTHRIQGFILISLYIIYTLFILSTLIVNNF